MSCKLCNHWRQPNPMDWDSDYVVGYCTLNPAWVKTTAIHYCSQMLHTTSHHKSTLIQHYSETLDEYFQKNLEARREIKDLKEKLKAARSKLRQATPPGSPDEQSERQPPPVQSEPR